MPAIGFNHVSVSATDLEASVRFYADVFGMRRLPAPNFGHPVAWLQVGDLQLHLFERDVAAPEAHHFALTLDPGELDAVYLRAKERGWLDPDTQGAAIRELLDGSVQAYLRDPGGNLVELDSRDVDALAPEVRADVRRLLDDQPQSEENLRATLFSR
jgi:catechol 2,3-dioxygenase-like lactoylglutathione lyase family enzyme